MAQGAGASDPEPRALRGAATAPRVTSGPRGRAQAKADRARTPPGRPLQLSARRLGRQKLCACGGRKHRSPEAGAASRSSRGRGWPPAGPWRAGRSAPPAPRGPRPRLSAEGTFGNTALQPPPVPSAFGRLSTSGRLRTVCPNSVYGGTPLERVSAFDGCGGRRAACDPPAPRHLGTRPRPARAQLRPARRQPHSPPVCATPPRAPHVWKSLRACPRDWLAPPSAVLLGPHVPQRVRVALVVRTEAPTSALARGTGR